MKDTVVKVSMTRILVAKDGTQENLLKTRCTSNLKISLKETCLDRLMQLK